MTEQNTWRPAYIDRIERILSTSTGVARVITDVGPAYVKAMGNPEGPHALASEWVGTKLADLLGLQTFSTALLNVDGAMIIRFRNGSQAVPGPAFCTRAELGHPWGGSREELDLLENPDDITRLVVFDTWVRNRDRHSPDYQQRRPNLDNVFLSSEQVTTGGYRLVAMDHTHCFTNQCELAVRPLRRLETVRDDRLYGLFPAFVPYLRRDVLLGCANTLHKLDAGAVRAIVASTPQEWDVDSDARDALVDFICERAAYVREYAIPLLDSRYGSTVQD